MRGFKWCHEVPPNSPPPAQALPAKEAPPPAQDQPPASPDPVPRPQAPPWGRWLERDTNACLSFQHIEERSLELCKWDDMEALPAPGKKYHQGLKLVNDQLPKGGQRLHRAAEYWRGIDGRALNNQ
ncbi:hypothetical protein QJQ45_010848 [Haematococcus lacustris]|nr:hypothetical protein QJQ45_010852 [Haematococcus lacustris]KAJ9532870.1 hypothetical protein QJQ45_010848 [Haematococcus lacustris]